MALILTPLFTDTFHRADGVLSAGSSGWSADSLSDPEWAVASNIAQLGGNNDNANYFDVLTGVTLPNDQYVTVTLQAAVPTSEFNIFVRTDLTIDTGYTMIIGPVSPSAGNIELTDVSASTTLFTTSSATIAPGDTFTLAFIGVVWFILHNGVQIGTGSDSNHASGTAAILGLTSFPGGVATDVQISNFIAGSAAIGSGSGTAASWTTVNMNNSMRGLRH